MGSLAHLLQEVFSEFKIVFQDECKHRHCKAFLLLLSFLLFRT